MHKNDLDRTGTPISGKYVVLLAALVVTALGMNLAIRFAATSIWDDAYFFSRYADNYRASGDYSWNPGEPPSYGLTSVAYGAWIWLVRLPGGEAPLSLWVGSMFWGMVALAGLWMLVRLQAPADKGQRHALYALFIGTVGMNVVNLAVHFSSGMDTSLAMAWLGGYLYLWKRFEGRLSPGKALLLGLWGGVAWFIRPDLLLFPILLPMAQALLGIRPLQRKMAGYMLLFTCFMVLLLMAGGVQYLGGLFPLSFYVKSLNSYGEGISKAYMLEGLRHLGLFFLWNLPLAYLLPAAWIAARRRKQPAFSRPDKALLLCLATFLAYHTFLVTPIMGYDERFLYPVWPILVYFTCKSWTIWMRARRNRPVEQASVEGPATHSGQPLRAPMPGFPKGVLAIAIVGICLWMAGLSWFKRPAHIPQTLGRMDVATAYNELGRNNWPYLPAFLYLGDSLKIASTELGILGAMAPRNVIYDLAGLHNLETARYGLDTDHLLRVEQPDLIYMPHPDYDEMIQALHADPAFREHYVEYPADSLHSWLGIALHKESPFFVQMQDIVRAGKNVE
jgi:hypothetical protein